MIKVLNMLTIIIIYIYNLFNYIVGRDLIGVQNLMKKHQAVVAEINNHESRIAAVTQVGQQMVDTKHFASEDIKQRLANLNKHWNHLKEKALQVQFLLFNLINIGSFFFN